MVVIHDREAQECFQSDRSHWVRFLASAFLLAMLGQSTDAESITVNDPTVTTKDHFGRSVEVHGNLVLVGTPDDDTLAENAGQADLFDTAGTLVRSFTNPSPSNGDRFGRIVSFDDNKALIGASGVEIDGMAGVGRAFLFDMTTGSLLQTFDDPMPTTGGQFGWGAAIDGNNVLVTAFQNDTAGENIGQAYLFDAVSGDLLQTFRDPTPTNSDEFGHFAALDGNYVVVGAPADDTNGIDVGQAYLFDVATGGLLHTFDNPSPDTLDRFGHSVWVDGENILIGAWGDNDGVGIAYLYNSSGDLLRTFNDPTPTTRDQFSRELAIAGSLVLIGDMQDDTSGENVGRAHLFDATTGRLLETFDDPTVTGNDNFGRSVALDGNIAVIGAHHDNTLGPQVGQFHIFTISNLVTPGDFNGDSLLTDADIDSLTTPPKNQTPWFSTKTPDGLSRKLQTVYQRTKTQKTQKTPDGLSKKAPDPALDAPHITFCAFAVSRLEKET